MLGKVQSSSFFDTGGFWRQQVWKWKCAWGYRWWGICFGAIYESDDLKWSTQNDKASWEELRLMKEPQVLWPCCYKCTRQVYFQIYFIHKDKVQRAMHDVFKTWSSKEMHENINSKKNRDIRIGGLFLTWIQMWSQLVQWHQWHCTCYGISKLGSQKILQTKHFPKKKLEGKEIPELHKPKSWWMLWMSLVCPKTEHPHLSHKTAAVTTSKWLDLWPLCWLNWAW